MMKEHIKGTSQHAHRQFNNSFVSTVSVIVGDKVNKRAHYDYNQKTLQEVRFIACKHSKK